MAAIYCADVWCDECAEKIRAALRTEDAVPSDPDDEGTYDSDEYPKWMGDDEESDSPQHCASGDGCVNALALDDGCKVGCMLGSLTEDGRAYVRAQYEERKADGRDLELTLLWADYNLVSLPHDDD